MHQFDTPHDSARKRSRTRASIVVVDPSPLSLIAVAGVLHSQGYACVCARTADAATEALAMGSQDLIVWDVADDAAAALDSLAGIRSQEDNQQLPAIFLAESRWAGLEKKAESMSQTTLCLFKPIDPNSLIAVVDQMLWMPSLVAAHRRRGSSPTRPGWVTL